MYEIEPLTATALMSIFLALVFIFISNILLSIIVDSYEDVASDKEISGVGLLQHFNLVARDFGYRAQRGTGQAKGGGGAHWGPNSLDDVYKADVIDAYMNTRLQKAAFENNGAVTIDMVLEALGLDPKTPGALERCRRRLALLIETDFSITDYSNVDYMFQDKDNQHAGGGEKAGDEHGVSRDAARLHPFVDVKDDEGDGDHTAHMQENVYFNRGTPGPRGVSKSAKADTPSNPNFV